MGVKIGSTSGYFWLDSWIMANIIQLGTLSFTKRFLNRNIDPTGRQYDQMTQAARSGQANIAEGSSRHQTSISNEMKLTDVARASISELASDYMMFLMSHGQTAWTKNSENAIIVRNLKLDRPAYKDDLLHEVTLHILQQKRRFDSFLENPDAFVAANALLILCARLNRMLTAQIERRLQEFRKEGGFSENMTHERREEKRQQSVAAGSPQCPQCGEPMVLRTARKGRNSGNQFWSCSDFPRCTGTRPYSAAPE